MARDVTAAPRTLMFLGSEIDDPEKERVSRSWRQTAGAATISAQFNYSLI